MIDFNKMYKHKKKRVVDPNLPPRPNLLSHEKTMKETAVTIGDLQHIVSRQTDEISRLRSKLMKAESDISLITQALRKR